MVKYVVDPTKKVKVGIKILEMENGIRVLSDYCWMTQGQFPCDGNANEPCGKKWGKCNAKMKDLVCGDEWGRVLAVSNETPPKNISEEWSEWAPESFGVSQLIEQNCYEHDIKTGGRELNHFKYMRNRIKYLLKGWSLAEKEPLLKLDIQPVPSSSNTQITDTCLNKVLDIVNKDIITGFYRGYERAIGKEVVSFENFIQSVLPSSEPNNLPNTQPNSSPQKLESIAF